MSESGLTQILDRTEAVHFNAESPSCNYPSKVNVKKVEILDSSPPNNISKNYRLSFCTHQDMAPAIYDAETQIIANRRKFKKHEITVITTDAVTLQSIIEDVPFRAFLSLEIERSLKKKNTGTQDEDTVETHGVRYKPHDILFGNTASVTYTESLIDPKYSKPNKALERRMLDQGFVYIFDIYETADKETLEKIGPIVKSPSSLLLRASTNITTRTRGKFCYIPRGIEIGWMLERWMDGLWAEGADASKEKRIATLLIAPETLQKTFGRRNPKYIGGMKLSNLEKFYGIFKTDHSKVKDDVNTFVDSVLEESSREDFHAETKLYALINGNELKSVPKFLQNSAHGIELKDRGELLKMERLVSWNSVKFEINPSKKSLLDYQQDVFDKMVQVKFDR